MKWFKDVKSLEELRKLYRRLVVEHHPDNGGSEDIIKEVLERRIGDLSQFGAGHCCAGLMPGCAAHNIIVVFLCKS